MKLWVRICEDSQDFGRGFAPGFVRLWGRICKTLVEDLQEFMRLWERIRKTLGVDLQGFARLWERIH